jgi:hypothetical protein
MLQKKTLASRKVEVTFRMPPMDDVVELYLCGDFNGWKVRGVPLVLEPDGTWVARLVLDAGKSYRFRYHDNQEIWHTDYEADGTATNAFGSDDSILDLTATESAPPKAPSTKAVPKKTAAPSKGKQGDSKTTAARRAGKARG